MQPILNQFVILRVYYTLILCLIFVFQVAGKTTGKQGEYNVVYDFKNDWYVYDESYENYVPYIAERHFNIPAHIIFCELDANKNYDLLIKCKGKNNFLFIEGSLKQKLPDDEWIAFPIKNWAKQYNKQRIYITIYGSSDIDTKWVGIVHKKTQKVISTVGGNEFLKIQPRNKSPFKSPISFLTMIVLAYFTYLSASFNRNFSGFYNIVAFFTPVSREQALFANKTLSRTNVLFIVLLSLIAGLLYLLLQSQDIAIFTNRWLLQDGETAGVLFSNYFKVSLIVFLAFLLKYFFIVALGKLFNIIKVVDLHFFKLIQASIIFYSLLTLVVFVLSMNYISFDKSWQYSLYGLLVVFYLLRTAIIFLAINRTLPIPILYLISYLCIVEVIPIFVGLQLVYQG